MADKKKKTSAPLATKFTSVDEYHASFPKEACGALEQIRKTIHRAVPKAVEVISYNIPAFKLNGVFIYYAAFKKHVSIYPVPSGEEWDDDFRPYHTSGKGTIQFPLDQPLPVVLIRKIALHLASEDGKKQLNKKKGLK